MTWMKQTDDFRAFWGVVPPPDETVDPSVSTPYSIGFNFSGNEAVVEIEGRGSRRSMVAMTGGFNGAEAIHWVGLDRPAECCAMRLSDHVRREVAEDLTAPSVMDLGDVFSREDVVLTSMALRLRAAGRGGWTMSGLELDEMGRAVLRHLALTIFGGRAPRANAFGLDAVRLARVVEFLDADLSRRTSLHDLADVATMSPFQFQRAFKATTGLSPHEFQTGWRMGRAAEMIRAGWTRSAVAKAVGYTPGHGFRTALRRYTGM